MNIIGDNIKTVRKINSLNQIEFAKVLGISQGTLSDIESGKSKPSLETLISLLEKFDVNLYWLIKGQSFFESKLRKTEIKDNLRESIILIENELKESYLQIPFLDLYLLRDELFTTKISNNENKLLGLFRRLKPKDQEDIISFIEVKLSKNKKQTPSIS
ncbi:helix-turn-helix domain-containing protein [Paenibacillus sp. FSL P2-0173]|uniref:helix-turn-helix domain-containing protein n=1 Tax=Paenibacillus sp. FSL P2-0173 TaxID=2921627 RepID=UPI0030F83EAA